MIQIYWLNDEQTILRLDYEAPITSWDEYQAAIDRSCEIAQQVSHPVSMIHNPGKIAMPSGNPIPQLKQADKKTPPNVDTIVMVINNRLAGRIIKTAIAIVRPSNNYKIVQSIEEAEALLSGVDSSI